MSSIGLRVESEHGAALAVAPLANAASAVALIGYLICAALSIVAPDVLMWFFGSWIHGLSLELVRPAGAWFRADTFVVGLITFGGPVWLAVAGTAWLYNRWCRS